MPKKEKTKSKSAVKTRQRLLEAASAIFAEHGFREATVAEICARADANIAAVNYHFRDKSSLYAAAWIYAHEKSLDIHPPDGGVPSEAPASERLRGRITSLIERITDPESHDFDIIHKEMANPTGLLAGVMEESLKPLRGRMSGIIRELLGAAAPEENVRLCQMSIISQCFGPLLRERCRGKVPGLHPKGTDTGGDVETLANHVAEFSLAGINARKQR